jgi:hypothetical protein
MLANAVTIRYLQQTLEAPFTKNGRPIQDAADKVAHHTIGSAVEHDNPQQYQAPNQPCELCKYRIRLTFGFDQ